MKKDVYKLGVKCQDVATKGAVSTAGIFTVMVTCVSHGDFCRFFPAASDEATHF